MKTIITSIILLLSIPAWAFQSDWNKGSITLKSGDKIEAELVYKSRKELLQYKQGEIVRTLSPAEVKFFAFQDKDNGLERSFQSYSYRSKNREKISTFLEIVIDGEAKFLIKETFADVEIPAPKDLLRLQDNHYNYYDGFVILNYQLYPTVDFKKEILPALISSNAEIRDYVKQNRLNSKKYPDQLRIIDYYNSLFDSNYKFAIAGEK